MQNIGIYDIEAEEIEKIADENDSYTADVIQAMLEAIKDNGINLADYM